MKPRRPQISPISLPSAEQIEEVARERGLSIPALCAAAGIAPSTFYRWKDGAQMTTTTMQRLVEIIEQAE
jgi:predicted transcriptional regulator